MPRHYRKHPGGGKPAVELGFVIENILRENPFGVERIQLTRMLKMDSRIRSNKVDCVLITLEKRGVRVAEDSFGGLYIVEEREKYLRGLKDEHQGREPGVRWGKLMGFNTGSS